MEQVKLIIPYVLYEGNKVPSLEKISNLCSNGADGLYFIDGSTNEEEHEAAIGFLKELTRLIDVPVLAGGSVKRLEDVKKYLYAGARSVVLSGDDDTQIDLIKESADRFGTEKVAVSMSRLFSLARAEEFVQLGATHLLVMDLEEFPLASLPQLDVPVLVQETFGEAEKVLASSAAGFVFLANDLDGTCMELKQQLKAANILVDTFDSKLAWSEFKINSDGLLPVIVQDYKTDEVLMMAYMNEEAFQNTLKTGTMTYYSRSRKSQWLKGETSGHFQYVKALYLDCDNDTLLAKVHQVGVACHTGRRSCFFQELVKKDYDDTNPLKVFEDVFAVIEDRKVNPKEGSYTNYLFDKGIDKILKKLGEEATEIVIAAKNPNEEEIKYEISDFLYHMMVLMAEKKVSWEDITKELANR